jgi:dolichol-phosphate mannosyltransferase
MTPSGYRAALCAAPREKSLVSVIIPTLNEVDNIDAALEAVLTQAGPELDLDVLVADGGSRDGTVERVRQWAKHAPVRLIAAGGRGGIAGDVLAAAAEARAEVVVVMDADLSHPAASIPDLVRPVLTDRSDVVVGSRYARGGGFTDDWPVWRRLLSRAGNALAWPLIDITDPMSGFFAVRRDRLLAVDPSAAGFKIGLEILAIGGDELRVAELPILFSDRTKGRSKIGLMQMAAYARRLMALAGGAISMGTATRFAAVGAAGLGLDLAVFEILFRAGLGLVEAHFISFALATVFNYALNSRWSFAAADRAGAEPDWLLYLRFLTVSLMSLFLRGGVLAAAVHDWGWPPELAIVLGIAAAAAVNYLGSAFFIFPAASPMVTRSVRWRIAAIGVVAYVVVLRLVFMGSVGLLPEEAYYWNYARHLDIGYLDHPPMVAWLIRLGTAVFGQNAFGVRFVGLLTWPIAAFFSFRFARDLFGKTAAFVTALLVAALPFYFAVGLFMTPDAPLTAAWAATLYFLERALLADRPRAWWGVGLSMGLGLLSKYTIALLGPAALLFMLLDARSRQWLRRPWPYLACALALLAFSPVVVWNAEHAWASFAFQSTGRLRAPIEFSLPTLVGWILALLTPVGAVTLVSGLRARAEASSFDCDIANRRRAFLAVLTLVPLSVFVAFSLFHEVKLDWTGPLWLATLPFLAQVIVTEGRRLPARIPVLYRSWVASLAIVLLIYGAALHFLALGLPGLGYGWSGNLTVGWPDFGRAAEKIAAQAELDTGRKPLLVGMDHYQLASELAFYAGTYGGGNAAGAGLFGSDGLMYDFWFKQRREAGRTMILFGQKPWELSDQVVAGHFDKVSPVESQNVRKGGLIVGRFLYRIGYDYKPSADALARP